MEYILVHTQNDPETLEKRVNQLIAEGWVPTGGVTIAVGYGRWRYAQAMTRTANEPGEG